MLNFTDKAVLGFAGINCPALLAELRARFSMMSSDEAMALLTPNGVVAGRISSYGEVRKNPDGEAAGAFIDVTDPDRIPTPSSARRGTWAAPRNSRRSVRLAWANTPPNCSPNSDTTPRRATT
ncbi:CoA transferase (plasmid) [Rhodococcus aetherivorans]|uniref:CoA transferase n=1 Tax=Rhodococcus aetherivorans TaxID=191292 RepID=UPI0002D226EC|nr:CoA transferase [Rhodococcus aetherivorans]CCW10789.1 hypothetical protein EBESD8_13200 [Rhodococcus aetherivorans]